MFMKANFFKQFRKDSNCIESSDIHEAENVRIPPKQPLLWGGLDDSDNSTSCDLDEDDEYFSGEPFTMNTNSDDRFKIKNPITNKWKQKNTEMPLKAQQRGGMIPERPVRKTNTDFDKSVIKSTKDIRSPLLKAVEADLSRSPPPSSGNPCDTPASPMLNFLKKKTFEEKQNSPDTRTITSSISPTIVNNISDVSSTECFNKDSNTTQTILDLTQSTVTHELEESCISQAENVIKPADKLNFLYQSLKDEATKMKRLKSQTELQLDNKISELQKAEDMIEKLRKSNLELQMSLENVSLKYKDELENRQKTAESLNELKKESEEIISRVTNFENLSHEVMEKSRQNNANMSAIKELYEKLVDEMKHYKTVYANHISVKERETNELQKEITFLRDSITDYKRRNDGLTEELETLNCQFKSEIVTFLSEIDQLSTKNVELQVAIETSNENTNLQHVYIEEQKSKIKEIEEKFTALGNSFTEMKNISEGKEKENEELKSEIASLNDRMHEMKKHTTEQNKILENETTHRKNAEEQIVVITSELENLKIRKTAEQKKMGQSLDHIAKQITVLNELFKERKTIIQNFPTEIRRIHDELSLHKEISDINGQNLILQAKEINKLKDEASNLYELLENTKDALGKLEVINQELKIENEFRINKLTKVEQQLTDEKCKSTELSNNVENLKIEYKQMKEKFEDCQKSESIMKCELDNLKKFTGSTEKEKDQYKALLEESKAMCHELEKKISNLEADVCVSNDEIKRLNAQSATYNKTIETGSMKLAQLNQVIGDLTLQLEYARQELATQKVKEKSLQEQLTKRDEEKSEMNKNHELLRTELQKKSEKQEQELKHALKEKDKEIQSLQTELDSKKTDTLKGNKRMEKKLSDAINQTEKLREQIKELASDKKELTKKLTTAEQQVMNLEKQMGQKVEQNEEQAQKHELLLKKMEILETQNNEQREKIAVTERELARLQKIEQEYREFQHQVYANSPPASTQMPAEIGAKITQTPKSPALSVRLNSMSIMKTPQKTPRSILKQPGSASKRRRVFFATESEEAPVESSLILTPIDSDEDSDECKEITLTSPCFVNTPKPNVRQMQSPERISNIRKTPSKNGPKITELKAKKSTGKASADWFDCDQLFGVGLED